MTNSSGSNAFQTSDQLLHAQIIDASGRRASVVSVDQSGQELLACVRSADGPQVRVPASLLERGADGVYRLPFSFDITVESNGSGTVTIPVLREELQVGKRVVDAGTGVRIRKTVAEREEVVDQPLEYDELEVERIPVDALVDEDEMPRMRYEGDTVVIPVLEEVLVVKKQMRLKEEVRITRHKRQMHLPQTMVLKSERVEVERFDERSKGQA